MLYLEKSAVCLHTKKAVCMLFLFLLRVLFVKTSVTFYNGYSL